MNCPTGGFPTIQDNKLHEFTALLSEVSYDVSVEPFLGESFPLASANPLAYVEDGACLDVAVSDFWESPSESFLGC